MLQRVGDVLGWENVSGGWWVIAVISLLILFMAFLVYRVISGRLNR